MITCPNCNHQNPDGAQQCEACYTPLPAMVACPSCGTPVQENASFCGQCGNDLRGLESSSSAEASPSAPASISTEVSATVPESAIPTENFLSKGSGGSTGSSGASFGASFGGSSMANSEVSSEVSSESSAAGSDLELPDLVAPDPLVVPDPISPEATASPLEASESAGSQPEASQPMPAPATSSSAPASSAASSAPTNPPASPVKTQLQVLTARLRHAQSDTVIEIPRQLSVVRIGKPNNQTPPDIDVSGFLDSDIVSRVHANLRVEGDVYYLEDVGSSNGTYVNGLPLVVGNRHRLRAGDRFALGKGDKVSFIFETA